MLKELEVGDVVCVDDSSQTRGIHIACGNSSYVTLYFDRSIPHEKTDELRDILRSKMKIRTVSLDIND